MSLVTIYGFEHGDVVGLAPGASDISPFVNKVITFCEFAGIEYEMASIYDTADGKERQPKGKAPYKDPTPLEQHLMRTSHP